MSTLDDQAASECIHRYWKSAEPLNSSIRASSMLPSFSVVPRFQDLFNSLKELYLECNEFPAVSGRSFPQHTAEAFHTVLDGIEVTTQQLASTIGSWPLSGGWNPDKAIEAIELRIEAVETLRQHIQRQFGPSYSFDEGKAARRENLENILKFLLRKNSIAVVGLESSDTSRSAFSAFTSAQSSLAWSFSELSTQPVKIRLDFVLLRLAQWRVTKPTCSTGALDRRNAIKLLTKLVHCGLVVCSLVVYHDQNRSKASWEAIIDILVEATVDALNYLGTKEPSLQVDPESCLTKEFDPAGTLEELNPTSPQQAIQTVEHSSTPLPNYPIHQEPGSYQIPLSLEPIETINSGSASSDSSLSSLRTDKLHVAVRNPSLPIESHPWFNSQITVEKDDVNATINVLASSNNHLNSAEKLDLSVAELIPYYTFYSGPLVLWFRDLTQTPGFLYFAEEGNKANLLSFHGFFMRRDLAGHYQDIESIRFDGKEVRNSRTCDSHPTAQIWDIPQTSTSFSGSSPLSSTRTFTSQTSFSSQHSRNVAAIGAPVESSRIFFFADTCIWAMSINEDVTIKSQKSQTLQILPKKSKGFLKIQAFMGDVNHPAGIPLAASQPHNQKLTDFRLIEVKFSTKDACRTFKKGFEKSLETLKKRRSSIEHMRRMQNDSIIEASSSFTIR